jgi:myo-inositol 2-dehydrogenase / D-chiro-inositol 1-dehydrogenase
MTDEHPEVRVGILGAGFVARRHVEKLTTLAGVRITSVADPQRERAESLAERCGAVAANGVEQVLDAGVDCLYVCVPPSEHGLPEELAIAAVLEGDRQFIEAVRGREADLRSPYAEALRTHRLAWAVAEAARTGATVGLTEAVHG